MTEDAFREIISKSTGGRGNQHLQRVIADAAPYARIAFFQSERSYRSVKYCKTIRFAGTQKNRTV